MHEALADLGNPGLWGRSQSVTSDEQPHEQTSSWFGSILILQPEGPSGSSLLMGVSASDCRP